MSNTVNAVYEKGAFRPVQPLPLDLAEGEFVAITVVKAAPVEKALTEDEAARLIKDAKIVQEWVDATKRLPSDDGGYDILKALDENRKWSGGRSLLPEDSAS